MEKKPQKTGMLGEINFKIDPTAKEKNNKGQ